MKDGIYMYIEQQGKKFHIKVLEIEIKNQCIKIMEKKNFTLPHNVKGDFIRDLMNIQTIVDHVTSMF